METVSQNYYSSSVATSSAIVCEHGENSRQYATVAACNLNQWALDFDGNFRRVAESIRLSKLQGAKLRVGTELELCGYGCEDHFLETDTFDHCWEVIFQLLSSDLTDDILCDIGMPVIHKSVAYNCRIFILNRRILLIRPKIFLANDGNYREARYFSQWSKGSILEDYALPRNISAVTYQEYVKFGVGIVECLDAVISSESCEELWTPDSPHINLALDGVDIFCNGSSSYYELQKLQNRLDLVRNATKKSGGVYIFSNQQGCDGGRLYYDGSGFIAVNGEIVKQAPQFSLKEVEVIVAVVDLAAVRSFRIAFTSRSGQAAAFKKSFSRILTKTYLCNCPWFQRISKPIVPTIYNRMEEIYLGVSSWLWDYLRRSNSSGFFVPLSGGADSGAVATLVGALCKRLITEALDENEDVLSSLEILLRKDRHSLDFPKTPNELCKEILHTCYMGTAHSTMKTSLLSKRLAEEIGSNHIITMIDTIIGSVLNIFMTITGRVPQFLKKGGSLAEDLALQNVQARIRMVLSYLLATLLPWVHGKHGWLLVLGTGNVDESLRGYFTKYDCSSGDINPIGSISKIDLKAFLLWASQESNLGYSSLQDILTSPPTAELRPCDKVSETIDEHSQNDEADMGMTYEELSMFGRLRKMSRCGPVSMFVALANEWAHLPLSEISRKVKHFFNNYCWNRHKMTVLTPSYHAESYSVDDNRFDHRPFLYPTPLIWQFNVIDKMRSGNSIEKMLTEKQKNILNEST
ncbi:putative glutamine-dependent naD(+) synthetase protein [Cardiosporidium cionae]|uniref:Glutamine-dependent NAD(+) synthetase n=1 Tax=Cardiosporidium cionae TaxID=476202 RepID=A0ABQ7JCF7_9APIC|nr:putative glutamine-dependent naD(+) synthetase protein [Cardiosporidium cionae]|eukprot:KAF8821628.1 putative glutamine-dependent naD(+) synthetase protein [Cardiosporidium cionae]